MRVFVRTAVFSLILGSASLVLSLSTGPVDGRTGAPSELTCINGCHSSFALNSGNGSLSILGPATFQAGQTVSLSVHLDDPGQSRWGFELTVLNASDQAVGSLVVVDPARTQKSVAFTGREYLKHTLSGTVQVSPAAEADWSFQWTAPLVPDGPVTFYAAGNAANNNGATTGDYIYTASLTLNPEVAPCCEIRTGDANGQGDFPDEISLGDIMLLVDVKFVSGDCSKLSCIAEADVNQDGGANPTCEDNVTLGDIMTLVDFLFITGPENSTLPACL